MAHLHHGVMHLAVHLCNELQMGGFSGVRDVLHLLCRQDGQGDSQMLGRTALQWEPSAALSADMFAPGMDRTL